MSDDEVKVRHLESYECYGDTKNDVVVVKLPEITLNFSMNSARLLALSLRQAANQVERGMHERKK